MEPLKNISDLKQLKALADEKRLDILRILMARPATLSQLGKELDQSAAHIRHHLLKLEDAGLITLVETKVVRGFVEKYYRASGGAYLLQELILPASSKPFTIVVSGSHDLALELLVKRLPDLNIVTLPVGSLEGLVALRQGSAQIAGCHLLDIESGEYNLPFVRHFFPDWAVSLVTLAHREQGLLVAAGNPQNIMRIEDLTRPKLRFVNRKRGSGTRLWLDWQLRQLELTGGAIHGYEDEYYTHTGIAERIASGGADAGLGLQAAAQRYGLEFIPLFHERYDLIVPEEQLRNTQLAPFFDYLQSRTFHRLVNELGGYETGHTGEIIST